MKPKPKNRPRTAAERQAIDRFHAAVEAAEARGMSRTAAVRFVGRSKPEVHRAFVEATGDLGQTRGIFAT